MHPERESARVWPFRMQQVMTVSKVDICRAGYRNPYMAYIRRCITGPVTVPLNSITFNIRATNLTNGEYQMSHVTRWPHLIHHIRDEAKDVLDRFVN